MAQQVSALILSLAVISFAAPVWAVDLNQQVNFQIPPQRLSTALLEFSHQAKVQIIVGPEVGECKTGGVTGTHSIGDALTTVLGGSSLGFRVINDTSITVGSAAALQKPSARGSVGLSQSDSGQSSPSSPENTLNTKNQSTVSSPTPEGKEHESKLEEIVVTGTNIRGVQQIAAPTLVFNRADIANMGVISTEELFEKLPQNVAQLSSRNLSASNQSPISVLNYEAASAVSLHGLGPESTLVLLNGKRRAGNVDGQIFDLSAIPLSMVDHVDVILGGYSAEYGSDAVAGVVNIVLRRDFDGLESQVNYGSSEHGGQTVRASQLIGRQGDRGGFVAAYDYAQDWPLTVSASNVSIGSSASGGANIPIADQYDLVPTNQRHSFMLSGHRNLSDWSDLYFDGVGSSSHTKLNTALLESSAPYATLATTNSNQYSVVLGDKSRLTDTWYLDLSGEFGAVDNHETFAQFYKGSALAPRKSESRASLSQFSAVADGRLLSLGAIDVSSAIGAEVRRERFSGGSAFNPLKTKDAARTIASVFGELHLPLIQPAASIPAVRTLDLSMAGRFDHYSDFGRSFNPQVGLIYKPVDSVSFRASYARAFRAPSLFELSTSNSAAVFNFPDQSVPSGKSPGLAVSGGNPNLTPEKARTWTVGMDYTPKPAPWLKIMASYFNIDYRDRLATFSPVNGFFTWLADPASAGVTVRNPTTTQVNSIVQNATSIANYSGLPYNPATQSPLAAFPRLILIDDRTLNISEDSVKGLDLSADSTLPGPVGNYKLGANGEYFLSYERKVTATSPAVREINNIGLPAKVRIRGYVGWTGGGIGAFVYSNFVGSYHDTATKPASSVASWTTFDVSLRYTTEGNSGLSWWGKDLTIVLGSQNVFNRAPPFVGGTIYGIAYDAVNASPLGRFTSVTLTKGW